jgi:mRNA interferase RelE/StbE
LFGEGGNSRFLVAPLLGMTSFQTNPPPAGCEKPSGQEKYRLRQGRSRVVYSISDKGKSVVVVKIAHRREAYR